MSKKNNPFNKDSIKDVEISEEKAEEPLEEQSNEDNKLQEEYDKLNQQYIRLAADFDNFRKRQV